jgi:hypothetical protein
MLSRLNRHVDGRQLPPVPPAAKSASIGSLARYRPIAVAPVLPILSNPGCKLPLLALLLLFGPAFMVGNDFPTPGDAAHLDSANPPPQCNPAWCSTAMPAAMTPKGTVFGGQKHLPTAGIHAPPPAPTRCRLHGAPHCRVIYLFAWLVASVRP